MQTQKIVKIQGTGITIRGNDIDTDRIIPARFLKEITFANMGNYAFYDERFDENGNKKMHPFNDEKYRGASILIVNYNFGCGSSREHAPQSLMRWGIKAIIGGSFADIFAGNCNMIGMPTLHVAKNDADKIIEFVGNNPQGNLTIDIKNKFITFHNTKINFEIAESSRKSLIEGTWDTTSMMLESKGEIKEVIARLPYLNDFK